MQKDLGAKGLVIITVATDPPKDKSLVADANMVIARHPSLPNNYLWDGPESEYQAKLKVDGMPAIYLFDRDNRWVKRWPEKNKDGEEVEYDYADIDKRAEGLLKKGDWK